MTLPRATRAYRPEHLLVEEIDGESALIDRQRDRYYALDDIGSRMWTVLTSSASVEQAQERLVAEFDVEPDRLRRDLDGLIQDLVELDLLGLAGEGDEVSPRAPGATRRRILLDERLDLELSSKGFVKLPFLEPAEADEFRRLAGGLIHEFKDELWIVPGSARESFWSGDAAIKRRIHDEVTAFLMPRIDRIVDNFAPLSVSLVEKEPGSGEVPMHQHWSLVDESRFETITIHIPLRDTTLENGALEVVPGSEKVFSKYRSQAIPQPFREFIPALKQSYCEPVELELGEAAVFVDGLIHYSPDNRSADNRLACNINLRPVEAKAIYHHWNPDVPNRLSIFAIDDDFLYRFRDPSKFEGLTCLGVIPFRVEMMEEADFAGRIAKVDTAIPAA
jgi:hypothetical protein